MGDTGTTLNKDNSLLENDLFAGTCENTDKTVKEEEVNQTHRGKQSAMMIMLHI